MSWEEVKVGDLGKVITGNTPPKKNPEFYGDSFKFIKPTDMIIDNKYTHVTEECYSQLAYEKYVNSLIPPFSTCVVTIGSIGKKMTMTNEYSFVNQAVNAVIPFEDKFDNHFVYYALKNILNKVKNADTGASSGRENVSKSNFMSLSLTVPKSLETQKRIASFLSNYDDLIENNNKRIKLLEETAQNMYKEWFVNFRFPNYEHTEFDAESGLPNGWKIKNINEIYNIKYGKNLPTTKITSIGNFPVYGASGIMGYYSEKNVSQKVALISSRGSAGKIHRTYEKESFITNNSFIVTPTYEYSHIPFFYIFESLKLLNLKSYCGGVAIPQLTNSALNNINILVPEKSVIMCYDNIIEPIYKQIDLLYNQNQKLKEARDILLPRLMNRTIEV